MRRLSLASLLLLLPLLLLAAEPSGCRQPHTLSLGLSLGAGAGAGVDALAGSPVHDLPDIEPVARGLHWAIVGEAPRLLRDAAQLARPVYSWLPPIEPPLLRVQALPAQQLPGGHFALLRIGTVQQLL